MQVVYRFGAPIFVFCVVLLNLYWKKKYPPALQPPVITELHLNK